MFSPYFSSVAPGIITLQDLHFRMKSELRWVDGRWKFNPATLSRAPLNYTWASSFYLLPGWQWGFEHMKAVCMKPCLRSDPSSLLRQRRRCSWAPVVDWCPKTCTARMGLGGWCWGDTAMSSQRSQGTHCGIGISCSERELLDCS